MSINPKISLRNMVMGLLVAVAAYGAPAQAATQSSPPAANSIRQRTDSAVQIDFDAVAHVPANWRASIQNAFALDPALLPRDTHFTVTAFRASATWMQAFAVPTRIIERGWEDLQDGDVIELIGYTDQKTGLQTAAVRGSQKASELSDHAQKNTNDPVAPASIAAPQSRNFLFPWTNGQNWFKTQGWHSGNALDLQPVVRTNPPIHFAVLAAESGTLSEVCNDGYQSMLQVDHGDGTSRYLHLDKNSVRRDLLGRSIVRGQFIALLYNGTQGRNSSYQFNTTCGYGQAVHLHFILSDRNVTINGYAANTVAAAAFATQYRSTNTRIDNNAADDDGAINFGETKGGQINPAGDTDDFTFNGTANQVVLIEQSKNNSSLDSYVELYAPDGNRIGEDDDSGGDLNSRLQRTLPANGIYKIRAKAYGNSTGAYNLRLTQVASQPAPSNCGGDCEGESRWISFGQTLNGTISPNNDTDTYYISLTPGRTVSLRMNRSSGSLDSYLDLYAPNGSWVASNDDGGGNQNSWLVHAATQSGTYRIVARSYQAASSGQYQLAAESVTATNLAQGKPAYASSTEFAGVEPWKAVDGNGGTRWSSRFANDQWWYVDLGQDRQINQVVINWESAYGRSFGIFVQPNSQSGTNHWTNVWRTSDGRGGITTASFNTVTARYVMFSGQTRATPYGFSFWEFGVYNTISVLAPTVPGDDASKLPDSEPQIVPLPPAEGGKAPQLGDDQEYEPLAGTDLLSVTLGSSAGADKPLAFIDYAGVGGSEDEASQLILLGSASAMTGTTGTIIAYEWKSDRDGLLSTQISATVPITQLSVGTHTISLRVQDGAGNWSEAATVDWDKAERVVEPFKLFIPMTVR